jgi:hypothetical protein
MDCFIHSFCRVFCYIFRPTAYGYLQYNLYQNPELYHESVAHFSKEMGSVLFIPPTTTPLPLKAEPLSESSLHRDNNNLMHHHDDKCRSHNNELEPPLTCHHHDDELTSIQALFPDFDPSSASFTIPYEITIHQNNGSTDKLTGTHGQADAVPIQIPIAADDCNNNFNNTILYVGQDHKILHLKFVLTGDQNAGKSTFLHSLTNSHDPSFLLLNRYLPILQASFYNARMLNESMSKTTFIDEYPFIDTDVGLSQLFLTTDDLLLCLDELCSSSQQNNDINPQSGKPRENRKKRQRPNPKIGNFVRSFDLNNKFQKLAQGHPYVCLEFVELGGDHLDRLAKYLLSLDSQKQHKCHSLIPSSALLEVCTAYSYLKSNSTSPDDNLPDSNTGTSELLNRTLQLVQDNFRPRDVKTPLSYFLNLETLCTDFFTRSISAPGSVPACFAHVDPQHFCLVFLRILMLVFVRSHIVSNDGSQSQGGFDVLITAHLLRAPMKAYHVAGNKPHVDFTTPPRFKSPFNQYLCSTDDPSKGIEEVIYPDLLFNSGDVELPLKPTLFVENLSVIESIKSYLSMQLLDQNCPKFFSAFLDALSAYQQYYLPPADLSNQPSNQNLPHFLSQSLNFCSGVVLEKFYTNPNLDASGASITIPSVKINFDYSTHTFPVSTLSTLHNSTTINDIRSEPGDLFSTIFSNLANALE